MASVQHTNVNNIRIMLDFMSVNVNFTPVHYTCCITTQPSTAVADSMSIFKLSPQCRLYQNCGKNSINSFCPGSKSDQKLNNLWHAARVLEWYQWRHWSSQLDKVWLGLFDNKILFLEANLQAWKFMVRLRWCSTFHNCCLWV